ncbi:CIC11C00000004934 [Sungouiella intermedia]|uniref:CIC11C00000004934 n=1 Tax=Sungouiella intermedia TaxID=45354 RepID=A0A1L0D4Y2_9ASCO|nr:CIC11C00000004934 [[Candida] intermedia]
MSAPFKLSTRAKVGLGLLISYTSFEAYMHIRTSLLIRNRQKLPETLEQNEYRKFESAVVLGMFVNPFEEYRPQTGFEFLLVRIMELVESFYGNKIELHDMYPSPEGDFAEVDHLLKTFKPNYELMRHNSQILQLCFEKNDFADLYKTKKSTMNTSVSDQMLFTWLGQSCSLVQISGINFLTDPMFSDHLISKSFGPKRLVLSPMTVDDVMHATKDNLNFVLVSHNHPDHLDMEAAKQIGNLAYWIVPLGLKKILARKGIYKVIEMDWWEKISINGFINQESPAKFPDDLEIVCVPAMHWSGRHIVDSNTSLWGSFILQRNGQSLLYHAGDTGYVKELYELIGSKFGPVTLSLLPIGQYCPSWHQKPRHISPAESLRIASVLDSRYVLGIHFGTFKLSSEPILEPKNKLLDMAKQMGKSGLYKVPEFGLTYLYHLDDGLHYPHFHVGKGPAE